MTLARRPTASPAGSLATSAVVNETRGTLVARRVEPASSFRGRFVGLMGRSRLPAGEGLWLPATKSIHMFFMRFSIDALFLAPADAETGTGRRRAARRCQAARREPGTWRVVSVRRGLAPWRGVVWWVRGADGCLELPAGTVDAAGVEEGDRLRFDPL